MTVLQMFTEHLCHLRMLFQKFRQSNLRMNGKKCKFAVGQVKYLGHILSGSGVAVDSSKFDLISGWPTPKTSKQVKSFLGVASYYRRFIERFSQISAPLRELIAKDKTFIWGKEQQDAFDELKNKLCNPQYYVFRIATGNTFWKQTRQYTEFHTYWDKEMTKVANM